ncbi:MAG: SPASM domain-containing protein [Elusimicrobiales bacterium]|nr:SPASM domain-containing protein [Elusimicrobiales bacterium]
MAKFRRALIEIGNACNLHCPFCAESSRPACFMSVKDFEYAAKQVNEFAKVISLHLLGEPLLHPHFAEIIAVAEKLALGINLVTNGSLAYKYGEEVWLRKCFRQVTFSAQSLICFDEEERRRKIDEYVSFAKKYSPFFKVSFRLRGNLQSPFVRSVSGQIMRYFGIGYAWDGRPFSLAERIFMNHGEIFSWRGPRPPQSPCLGLRHHFGILSDGTVVPCCADYGGKMAMGNIFKTPLAEILNSPETLKLRRAIEGKSGDIPDYCKNCGFLMP